MDEVTFTKVRSQLPVMDEGANKDGKRYCLVRHKKQRLVVLGYEDYQKLVRAAGSSNTATMDAIRNLNPVEVEVNE